MPEKYYMALDDSPDHAAALGRLLGHWAVLETHLMRMLEYLLQTPDHYRSDFVYKEFIALKSKVTLLKRLNRWFIQDTALRKEINDILSDTETLNNERNSYIHARWLSVGYGDDSNQLIRISTASPGNINKLYKDSKRVTPQDIQSFVEDIVKLSLSFQELLDRVFPESSI